MDIRSTAESRLATSALELVDRFAAHKSAISVEAADLDLLIREARAHEHRRAHYIARDKATYRLGGAFEPVGGLDLDAIQLGGFLAAGLGAVVLLANAARDHPDADIVTLLRTVFNSKHGRALRAIGVYRRWTWLQHLYERETTTFLQSKKGRDPKARWRAEKPTTNQKYLAAEIGRLLQIVTPRFENRGAAFDWIRSEGGNPRFWQAPPTISLNADEGRGS